VVDTTIYLAIIIMAAANLLTRAIPFLFFVKKEPPASIVFVETHFPPIIMTILIFYTLGNVELGRELAGLKEILAIALTAGIHIRFNNYLLSIFSGTIFYMVLIQHVGI
jgi:branched-subunit amino acid transport protein AzlD